MEIMLVGGPYNGEWINVNSDNWNPPMSHINMPTKPEYLPITRLPKGFNLRKTMDLIYKLKRVDTSAHNWHYEYHYQDRQLDEVVIGLEGSMSDHELLAAAPLSWVDDGELFSRQKVSLIDHCEIQWDFIMRNGKDLHFRNKLTLLRGGALAKYKDYMRRVISKELDR